MNDIQHYVDSLSNIEHPALAAHWCELPGVVKLVDQKLVITLPFAHRELSEYLSGWVARQWPDLDSEVVVDVKPMQSPLNKSLAKVKNIIAISSAKGGVGKSTSAINLALALQHNDVKVGILDADIYGPSIPLMLGTQAQKPQVIDGKWMKPIEQYGIFAHSIGYLVAGDEAAIWRGPMASKAFNQLLNETLWPELDYLIIDMPPGTGDIQLTLAQQVPVNGAVVVTTPQDLALADAVKGVAMFNKVDVPVLGIVENMSYHRCENCGHHSTIFGEQGAVQLAQQYDLSVLAQIPLHLHLRQDIDQGRPTVVARPTDSLATVYYQLADTIAAQLFWTGRERPASIAIKAVDSD